MGKEITGDITKFGILRRNFLKEHCKGAYAEYEMQCSLKQHLLEVQEQAEERLDVIMEQMCRAEEIVLNEIIYV